MFCFISLVFVFVISLSFSLYSLFHYNTRRAIDFHAAFLIACLDIFLCAQTQLTDSVFYEYMNGRSNKSLYFTQCLYFEHEQLLFL